jgi:inorganic pyrophosphatase
MSTTEITADVYIEISKDTHIKYEYNKVKKILECDRILSTPVNYIFNYGFIPNTLSEDDDPIDVVVLMDDALIPGCLIKCKFLGCLETKDSAGGDPKLIMCPCKKVDPSYSELNDLTDIKKTTLQKIKYFFQRYKDLENKTVEIGNFLDKTEAIKIYHESVNRYKSFSL